MATVELILAIKTAAYVAANPTKVLSLNEPIYLDDGTFAYGDGVTPLSGLTWFGGAVTGFAPLASPVFTGTPTVPTAAPGTNTDQAASTAFVLANGGLPRSAAIASSATPSIDISLYDCYSITALAAAITGVTITGAPVNFQPLIVRIKDNGTARAITWGASFIAMGEALPTATTLGKILTVAFLYDSVLTKWGCVGVKNEA